MNSENNTECGFINVEAPDRSPDNNIRYLEERVQYLEEVNRYTLDALEMAASLGDFQHSINKLQDHSSILKETRSRVERFIKLQATAFYLVDDDTNEFLIAEVNPLKRRADIDKEVDFLVENGTFAWALMEKKPIFITCKTHDTQLILHTMSTSSRTRGMFVGLVEKGVTDIPNISLSLLSIILLNSSNALESFKLYKRIRESEERFRLINENALDIMFTASLDGTINFVNPAWERLLGHKPPEVLGRHFLDFVPPEDKMLFTNQFENIANQHQKVSDINAQLIAKNGALGHFSISSFPNIGNDGSIIGRVGVLRDISKRFQTECELAAARTAAEAASQAKSEFLANMSHEIRTPLNGVIATLNLLEESDLNSEQQYHLEMASVSAESLLGLINDILDFSKIEAGKLEIEDTPFNLEKEVNRLLNVFAPKASEKGVELIAGYAPNAPRFVIGDSNRLRQVLYNLVGNAMKFTEHGHIWVNVECLQSNGDKATFKIRVKDTGIGIPKDQQNHIFDHFAQADASTTRKFGGTGLGLAICKQLIGLMDGQINVSSTSGKGTTFTAILDLHIDKETPDKTIDTAVLGGYRTLVVDDNEINLRIFSEYFNCWNVRHDTCSSARTALRALRKAHQSGDPYNVVVTDYIMPDMNGDEWCAAVKSDADLKDTLIIISAMDRHDNTEHFQRTGFSAYLTKPLNMSDFLNIFLSVVEQNHDTMITSREITAACNDNAKQPIKVKGATDTRILLVEDYPINREVTVAILNKIGFSDIVIAENGQVAVDMFRRKTAFDLILMDIQMPVMDGCEATGHIRRMENGAAGRVPIIAMTANALEGDRENYLEAGMDDYISKPVRKERLIEVLGRWTNKNQTQVPAQKTVSTDTGDASSGCMVFNSEDTMSRYDDDSEVVRMIIEKFIEQTPGTIKEIETALASENSARAGSRAHALKGGAAYIGAERVRKIAFDMEMAGRIDDLSEIASFLPKLQAEFDLFQKTIKAFRWDR